eukprot:2133866-Rhodomonas_salina.1
MREVSTGDAVVKAREVCRVRSGQSARRNLDVEVGCEEKARVADRKALGQDRTWRSGSMGELTSHA